MKSRCAERRAEEHENSLIIVWPRTGLREGSGAVGAVFGAANAVESEESDSPHQVSSHRT
jgi:hypothetical protein